MAVGGGDIPVRITQSFIQSLFIEKNVKSKNKIKLKKKEYMDPVFSNPIVSLGE